MKQIGVILIMALAMLSISGASNEDLDMLGVDKADTILESDQNSLIFPETTDGNYDILTIGNDKSFAFGPSIDPIAANNLEIRKNQDSGDCVCCNPSYKQILPIPIYVNSTMQNMQRNQNNALEISTCQDCCIKMNIDNINVGDRTAIAFGFSEATNNEKIVANQQ